MSSPTFVHLNTRSHYTLHGSAARPGQIARQVGDLHQPAAALADVGCMHGAVEFQRACDELDVKAIHGVTVRLAIDTATPVLPYELILLASTNAGLPILFDICSRAKRRHAGAAAAAIDLADLRGRTEELLALISLADEPLTERSFEVASTELHGVRNLFGSDRLFVALKEGTVGRTTGGHLALAETLGLGAAATPLVIATSERDLRALTAIRASSTKSQSETASVASSPAGVVLSHRAGDAFTLLPDAVRNAVEVADRCHARVGSAAKTGSRFPQLFEANATRTLRARCESGIRRRYTKSLVTPALERLNKELGAITERGVEDLFLLLGDLVSYLRGEGFEIGPGRGAAAAWIVNYALEVTDVDPLDHDLMFERALGDTASGELLQIDLDMQPGARAVAKQYLERKLGSDRVAGVATFHSVLPRQAVRQAARAVGEDHEADRVAALVPDPHQGRFQSLEHYVANDYRLARACAGEPTTRQIVGIAGGLVGLVDGVGEHAAALAVSGEPLVRRVPLASVDTGQMEKGVPATAMVTAWGVGGLREVGVYCQQLLGLGVLELTARCLDIIETATGQRPDVRRIPLDDEATFAQLRTGRTHSSINGHREPHLRVFQPTCLADLADAHALSRPQVGAACERYLLGRRHPDTVSYLDDRLRPILERTGGVVVYQEQLMRVARDIGGMDGSAANETRRACGKKQASRVADARERFTLGAMAGGVAADNAREIWRLHIDEAADWSFHQAHALSYALIGYRLAWLETHHPGAFAEAHARLNS